MFMLRKVSFFGGGATGINRLFSIVMLLLECGSRKTNHAGNCISIAMILRNRVVCLCVCVCGGAGIHVKYSNLICFS
jgi:hypothetical protein